MATKLTMEDKIVGRSKPKAKTKVELEALTEQTKYTIQTIGLDNKSIVTGEFLENILSIADKQKLRDGEKYIEANGFIIEKV